ncbi:MAG TPA: phosphatase PAP2 family protein [Vicinamibacterales bacterium]|nr:phosphatase PAP2 family protein [Vicinamibacterales bacterium]
MSIRRAGRSVFIACVLAISGLSAFALAQSAAGGFEGFWGSKYASSTSGSDTARSSATRSAAPSAPTTAGQERRQRPAPNGPRSRLVHWNRIAIDASGVDHTPVAPGEDRVFGEQIGPGRASRAMAIVHIAIFDAVNAIDGEWASYTNLPDAPAGASVNAAIAQAAHDTLSALFPSQASALRAALVQDLDRINDRGKDLGRRVGRRAAAAILAERANDGSETPEPRLGDGFNTSDAPGQWRQDPVSELPVALGAFWGDVKPFVIESGRQFRVGPPPAMNTRAYAAAFDEAKRLGGDGTITPSERTAEQASIGIYWAYDGTPSLCAPPRLYNQVAMTIADQMGTGFLGLTRLLTLVNVAMADSGIAIWESKYHYQFWRPVTGIREADRGTGPSGLGDGNRATIGDLEFLPMGAPASNLTGPDFTPPFPSYPSGHAGFGGALFEVLRQFYGTDNIAFTFTSDEYNGMTRGQDGEVRPLHPRSFTSLSQAEEENGQSRIYLGIHWSFDKTQGIAQGRRVARYVLRHAFGARP